MSRFTSASEQDAAADDQETVKTLSMMSGGTDLADDAGPDLDLDGGDGRPRISQGTLLLITVLAIGAAGVLVMRQLQGDLSAVPLAREVEKVIDDWLRQAKGPAASGTQAPGAPAALDALLDDTDEMLASFVDDPEERQVPLEYVKKNPFMLPEDPPPAPAVPVAVATAPKPADEGRARDQQRRRLLEQEYGRLKLQAIMSSRTRPMAMVDGQVVGIGHRIGSFTVKRIGTRTVELSAGDETFVIVLSK